MFKKMSNAAFNNDLIDRRKMSSMHETMKRLYLAAKELMSLDGQSAVARKMNLSPQRLNNWEARGMSKQGMLIAEQTIGCSALWLESGAGQMFYLADLSPSSNTNAALKVAESCRASDNESAMLLNFPDAALRSVTAKDTHFIPQYASGGSMGHGLLLPDQPGVIENWSVSREWLNKNVRNISAPGKLCIVTGFGPSMQPMFNPGDPLLVDTGVNSVLADGIYFFRVGSEGFIKQLQKIPTASGLKYIAKSKNPDYDSFEISEDMDFEVLGKVVRVWCGTDF